MAGALWAETRHRGAFWSTEALLCTYTLVTSPTGARTPNGLVRLAERKRTRGLSGKKGLSHSKSLRSPGLSGPSLARTLSHGTDLLKRARRLASPFILNLESGATERRVRLGAQLFRVYRSRIQVELLEGVSLASIYRNSQLIYIASACSFSAGQWIEQLIFAAYSHLSLKIRGCQASRRHVWSYLPRKRPRNGDLPTPVPAIAAPGSIAATSQAPQLLK